MEELEGLLELNKSEGIYIDIGTKVYLEIEGVNFSVTSIFIGMLKDEFMIITLPKRYKSVKNKLFPANKMVVKYLYDGSVYAFQTTVIETITTGENRRPDPQDPARSIASIALEQKRLLDVISKSFNGMRHRKDVMHLKAFHESFIVLSEIIGKAIDDVLSGTSLTPAQYENINTLVDNQDHLISRPVGDMPAERQATRHARHQL